MQPNFVTEGDISQLTLRYSILQGVVEQQMWFFHGIKINSNSHYSVENRSLVIFRPTRNDTGQYTLLLTNPFNSVTVNSNVAVWCKLKQLWFSRLKPSHVYVTLSVSDGPDEPTLEAHPVQPFYKSGDSLSLSCQADGFPQPTVEWLFSGQTLSESHSSILNITDVQTDQGGEYTCVLRNEETAKEQAKSINIKVYGMWKVWMKQLHSL